MLKEKYAEFIKAETNYFKFDELNPYELINPHEEEYEQAIKELAKEIRYTSGIAIDSRHAEQLVYQSRTDLNRFIKRHYEEDLSFLEW